MSGFLRTLLPSISGTPEAIFSDSTFRNDCEAPLISPADGPSLDRLPWNGQLGAQLLEQVQHVPAQVNMDDFTVLDDVVA